MGGGVKQFNLSLLSSGYSIPGNFVSDNIRGDKGQSFNF